MFKIMKYLGEFKASAAAVILLLILQAYCDLSLPSYTSDIVDVGIEQGGIENAVPEIMRAETALKMPCRKSCGRRRWKASVFCRTRMR